MTTEPPIIEFRNVTRSFGSQMILRNVSFKLERGQTVAVIGESGCGKSVTLKLMIGLIAPNSGDVLLDGRSHASRSERELTKERLRFGYVFQGAALFDSLTVGENIAFPLRQNTQMTDQQIHNEMQERLRDVGLPPLVAHKRPAELSGGMKKRVGLARALALQPEIMLYDEPTTGLDPIMTDVINTLIAQTREKRPMTSVVVTHEMSTVGRTADRVLMLYPLPRLEATDGQVVFDGSPAEAFSTENRRVYQFVHGMAGERLEELAVK